MALVVYDRVQETTATTGTGSITLGGAVSGYQSFAVVGNGNSTFYCILNGSAWEVGIGTYSTTGPTLARTTVLSNSNGNTSPITLVGASTVFCTYPAEKSVNLDSSGNVSALGTITSGVWNGTTIPVAYGGTGVTTSSGANSVVLRDANQNVSANNFLSGYTITTAAGGTTVLTAGSTYYQKITGATTQTMQLPDATTCVLGQTFVFDNDSTGVVTITNNASGVVDTVPTNGFTIIFAESVSTSAGSWGKYALLPATYDFSTSTADFGGATITNAVWNGTAIASGYGGTGLTTFVGANNALYSTSSSALTAGTLPVPAGGTGQTTFASGYIPYGNTTAALQSSSLLQFNGSYLQVGGGSVLGGATNPITAFSQSANNYVQTYTYNPSTGTSGSADFVAYTNNSTDAHGWADMGFTSSTYADPVYTVTGPNEAYLLGSAFNNSFTGNLVYATDNTGSANAHQWYVGGFTQAKSAWKMQLTSTGLQLANALGIAYGGTGQTTAAAGFNALSPITTTGDLIIGNGTNSATRLGIGTSGYVLTSNGTTAVWQASSGGVTTFSAGTTGFTPSSATSGAITLAGTLAVTNGGTGLTSVTASYIPYGNGTSALNTSSSLTYASSTLSAPIVNASNGIHVNSNTVAASYSIPSGSGAMSVGPMTIASGQTVTVPTGSRWVVL